MREFCLLVCSAVVLTIAAGPALSAPDSPIELKLSHHVPPVSDTHKAFDRWAKRLEQETNGRVKVTIYPSSSLSEGKDAFPSAASGVCDVAFVSSAYEPSRWALNHIMNNPALQIPTDERGGQVWDQLWGKFPVMLKEFEGVKPLTHWVAMPYTLHLRKKSVRKPDEIRGMKICCTGSMVNVLKAAGAAPVGMPSNEWYSALERGVADGILSPYNVMTDRGLEALLPYHLDLNIGQGGSSVIVNLKKWNSLPPDIKGKIEELNPWLYEISWKANDVAITNGEKKCKDAGQTILKPTPEELKAWLALATPMSEDWIEKNKSKGPTREMFEWTQKLLAEKYRK